MQFAIKCPREPPVQLSGRVETNVVSLSTVVEPPQKLLLGINVIQTCLTLASFTSVLLSPVLSTRLAVTQYSPLVTNVGLNLAHISHLPICMSFLVL